MSFHKAGSICDGCEQLLEMVHPDLDSFFHWAKVNHPDLHIAEGWRSEKDQNADYSAGKSHFKWPQSKHNCINGELPCSKALDLFQIGDDGKAKFDVNFYRELYDECIAESWPIRWGGNFLHLRDYDHYELEEARQN